jgi:hypothetical protein
LEGLPPWPDNEPLPLPRFGSVGPSAPKPLQAPGQFALIATEAERFAEAWEDTKLGLRIFLQKRSGPRGTEIWAAVASTHPADLGLQVSVALLGNDPDRFARRTVPLAKVPLDGQGSCGEACFGTEEALYSTLGDKVRIDAFLIEPGNPVRQP